jgi:predicted DNA-binding transcriptional regulator YafY
MATHADRIERLKALVRLIPRHGLAADCPDPTRLLERVSDRYKEHRSDGARRRALQRDLEELVGTGDIEVVNPGGKPLRYRRLRDAPDANIWGYVRQATRELIASALPARRFDDLWAQLLDTETDPGLHLGPDKLRIVSDSLRLQPAAVKESVLADVLEALARSLTLQVGYRSAPGRPSSPTLHPQGLLQRGPRLYLFALKDDETEPLRMYALHRFTRSTLGTTSARAFPGFDLQALINRGAADFSDGELIDLEMRARGYIVELLRDCPLADRQRIEDESGDSEFEVRVLAQVPASGQLLRWLLGCGDNVEVLAPDDWRHVLAAQAAKMAALYASRD